MDRNEAIGAGLSLFFGIVTAILSVRMPLGSFRMAGPGLFPLCLGILLVLLSVLFLISRIFGWGGKREAGEDAPPVQLAAERGRVVFFMAATLFATACMDLLGYPLSAFILMLSLLQILGVRQWVRSLGLSLMTAGASYFLFVQWLKIPLPKGWIGI